MISATPATSDHRREFAREMQQRREALGLKMARAAERAGLSIGWWSALETDRQSTGVGEYKRPHLSRDSVLAVAKVLGWDPVDAFAKAGLDFDPHNPPVARTVPKLDEATFMTLFRGLPDPQRKTLLKAMQKWRPAEPVDLPKAS